MGMETVEFDCPACGEPVCAGGDLAGQDVTCPHCSVEVRVPGTAPAATDSGEPIPAAAIPEAALPVDRIDGHVRYPADAEKQDEEAVRNAGKAAIALGILAAVGQVVVPMVLSQSMPPARAALSMLDGMALAGLGLGVMRGNRVCLVLATILTAAASAFSFLVVASLIVRGTWLTPHPISLLLWSAAFAFVVSAFRPLRRLEKHTAARRAHRADR